MPVDEFTAQNSSAYTGSARQTGTGFGRPSSKRVPLINDADDGSLSVRGLTQERIGELAWHNGVMLYELAPQSASLEEAFVESTEGNLEFGGAATARGTRQGRRAMTTTTAVPDARAASRPKEHYRL